MKSFKPLSTFVILFTAILPSILPTFAHADTYQYFALGSDDHYETYGLSGSGAAVVFSLPGEMIPCPSTPLLAPCYITYVQGVAVSRSSTPPTIDHSTPFPGPPPGPGCAGLPSFVTASDLAFNFCVNGYEFFGIGKLVEDPSTGKEYKGVYTGPDLDTDLFGGAPLTNLNGQITFSFAYVDQYGDLLWDSATAGEIYEAYNVTAHSTPEPSALTLLTTGALATAAAIRKRRRQT